MSIEKKQFFSQADELLEDTKKYGGTSRNVYGRYPMDGYMVAIDSTYTISPEDLSIRSLKKFIGRRKKLLTSENEYLGTWKDEKSGEVHLNVSRRFEDRGEAISLARSQNSIAIYDVKNHESIYIDYDK